MPLGTISSFILIHWTFYGGPVLHDFSGRHKWALCLLPHRRALSCSGLMGIICDVNDDTGGKIATGVTEEARGERDSPM